MGLNYLLLKYKMAFARPFAYNPGSQIPGTEQIGDLSIGAPTSGFTNNPQYWNGPDEDLGYVIAQSVSGNTQPTQLSGVTASVGFFRSEDLTEGSFIVLSETISGQSFANGNDAVTWLNNNGYWTSFIPVPVTPTNTPTNTPTRTPTPTVTPTNTPTNTPYPPNTYFFYLPEGANPAAPTLNGNLMFTTNGGSEVGYNPNTTDEVVIYLTDKSGLYHPSYLDAVTYGGVITMTQGSNTAILSADTGQWASYVNYISGNYLEVVQSSPNPFVSGSPINLVLTVNYPPTPTPTPTTTPTNTPTPSSTPIPVTGYAFNLIATPYNFPAAGNSIMNAATGSTGSTLINDLATPSRGFYFNSFDNDGIDRTSYFSTFTGQSVTITFSQTGSTAIYSGDTSSFKQWVQSPQGSGFVFGTNIGVPPSGTPSGTAILIQSASTPYNIGFPVYVSLVSN
jgi:hypothetical protein